MPIGGAPPVYLQGVAAPSPLLEPALSFGSAGTPALATGLRVGEGGEEMLALPMHIRAELTGEVRWPVRANTLGEPVLPTTMQSGKGPVLLVGVNEEVLPSVDFSESPLVKRNGPRVFSV